MTTCLTIDYQVAINTQYFNAGRHDGTIYDQRRPMLCTAYYRQNQVEKQVESSSSVPKTFSSPSDRLKGVRLAQQEWPTKTTSSASY